MVVTVCEVIEGARAVFSYTYGVTWYLDSFAFTFFAFLFDLSSVFFLEIIEIFPDIAFF